MFPLFLFLSCIYTPPPLSVFVNVPTHVNGDIFEHGYVYMDTYTHAHTPTHRHTCIYTYIHQFTWVWGMQSNMWSTAAPHAFLRPGLRGPALFFMATASPHHPGIGRMIVWAGNGIVIAYAVWFRLRQRISHRQKHKHRGTGPDTNDSYRRYVCGSNEDAVSAS
jgi:hypothetical protein